MKRRLLEPRFGRGAPVLLLCLFACASSSQRPSKVVRRLDIKGNDHVRSRAIKKKILTTKTGWWPRAEEQPFDPVAWSADLERVGRLYESKGFYAAEVDGEVLEDGKRSVSLWIKIKEGIPTVVSALTIEGLESLPPEVRAEVLEDPPIKVGDVLVEDRWNFLKAQLENRLRNLGYLQAEVRGVGKIDVKTRTAVLAVEVSPGQVFWFGDVVVRNEGGVVNRTWIADEVRVGLGTDRKFSDERLREAERRVVSMGVFAITRVTLGDIDAEKHTVPVIVEITEAPFRTLRLGGGVGFDQVRNEGRLLAEWTHRNWLGGLRILRLRSHLGYAYIPNAWSVLKNVESDIPRSGPTFIAAAEVTQPRLFGAPTLAGRTSLEGERRLEQAYTALSVRGNVGVTWRPRVDLAILPSYQIEVSNIDAPGAVTPELSPLVLGCDDNPCFQRLSFLEQTATYDRRDNPIAAKRGYMASLSVQEGGGPVGGDFDYLRGLAEGRVYVTPEALDDEWTLAARVQVGAIFPYSGNSDNTPVSQRFYGGGAISMRGFNNRRLSPLLGIPVGPKAVYSPTVPLATLPIGGNGILIGSVEIRYALTTNLQLAVFLDSGEVTRGAPSPADLGGMLYATGFGLRYATPIGPIRLDVARRLPFGRPPVLLVPDGTTRRYRDDTSCFGIGGSRDPYVDSDGSCVLHISIGEAF